jgi:hypothetical protein
MTTDTDDAREAATWLAAATDADLLAELARRELGHPASISDQAAREAIARHLADQDAATHGALPYADPSWAGVRTRWYSKADAILTLPQVAGERAAHARMTEAVARVRALAEQWQRIADGYSEADHRDKANDARERATALAAALADTAVPPPL